MKSEFLQLLFYALSLVVGGAFEEFLPSMSGVGFPILLAVSIGIAARRPVSTAVVFALAAGACEDALSSLPMMASPCFFLIAALIAWRLRIARVVMLFAYPAYQIWLTAIVPNLSGSVIVRLLLAFPIAAMLSLTIIPLLTWLEGKVALDAE